MARGLHSFDAPHDASVSFVREYEAAFIEENASVAHDRNRSVDAFARQSEFSKKRPDKRPVSSEAAFVLEAADQNRKR